MRIKEDSIVKPLPFDSLIKSQEDYWRLKLPTSFVAFIKENNGAEVEATTFDCDGRERMIERFLCILGDVQLNPDGMYDIGVVLTQIEDRLSDTEDLIGADVLPIAVLFAGDFVCLDFRKDADNPVVCVWSHEESEYCDPVLYNVADNFADFLTLLD